MVRIPPADSKIETHVPRSSSANSQVATLYAMGDLLLCTLDNEARSLQLFAVVRWKFLLTSMAESTIVAGWERAAWFRGAQRVSPPRKLAIWQGRDKHRVEGITHGLLASVASACGFCICSQGRQAPAHHLGFVWMACWLVG